MPYKSDKKSRIATRVGVEWLSPLFRSVGQTAIIIPGLILFLSGCGGSAVKTPPPQVVAQIDSQTQKNRLQDQLTRQVSKVSVPDYTDYKVGPEDSLEIRCLDTEKLNTEARVSGQGEIRVQLLGDVPVAGLTSSEIAKKLARLYREGDYLKNPNITVAVKAVRHQKVAVTGAVNKPDDYALIGPRSLLEVLGMAGGLSDKAGETAHIIRSQKKSSISVPKSSKEPFSPGTETIVVDLDGLLRRGATQLNYTIQNGDVVHVPFAQTAYVLGSVTKPGGVSIKENLTVSKAVAQVGGQHILLSSNSATILRLDDNGQRTTIKVNLAEIAKGKEEDLPLKENDIVFVQESSLRRALFDFKMLLPGSVSVAPAAF